MARNSFRAVWTLGLVLGSLVCVQPVAAQAPSGFLRINGVYPVVAPAAFDTALEIPLYDETAAYDIRQEPGSTIFYDATVGAGIRQGLAAAVSVSFLDTRNAATASGSIPSPLFFESARTASFSAELDRRQIDVHLQAVYYLPTPGGVDVAFSGGPSLLRVTRASVSSVALGAESLPFRTISITGLGTTPVTENAIGANIGADVAFMPTRVFGIGIFFRYVVGSIEAGSQEIDVGGLQAGAGLRFRF